MCQTCLAYRMLILYKGLCYQRLSHNPHLSISLQILTIHVIRKHIFITFLPSSFNFLYNKSVWVAFPLESVPSITINFPLFNLSPYSINQSSNLKHLKAYIRKPIILPRVIHCLFLYILNYQAKTLNSFLSISNTLTILFLYLFFITLCSLSAFPSFCFPHKIPYIFRVSCTVHFT